MLLALCMHVKMSCAFACILQEVNNTPLLLRLKVAEDNYQDEQRIKVTIYKAEHVKDWVKEGQASLEAAVAITIVIMVQNHCYMFKDGCQGCHDCCTLKGPEFLLAPALGQLSTCIAVDFGPCLHALMLFAQASLSHEHALCPLLVLCR